MPTECCVILRQKIKASSTKNYRSTRLWDVVKDGGLSRVHNENVIVQGPLQVSDIIQVKTDALYTFADIKVSFSPL